MPVFALGLEFDLRTFGVTCGESRTSVEKTVQGIVQAVERFGYDWAVVFPDDYVEFEPLGLTMHAADDVPTMPLEYLALARTTLSGLRIPDAHREMRLPIHLEMIRRLKDALGNTVCVTGRIAAPFSALALVYGVEPLLVATLEDPGLVHDNLKFFAEHQIAFGMAQIRAGADLLWLGDCLASSHFISAADFGAFAFEPAAAVAETLSRAGGMLIYHAAETSSAHLKLELELPVAAVNVGEGVSIAELKRTLAANRCLMGNFDPLILRDGTPEVVRAAVEHMILANRCGGCTIFNTGEGITPDTPVENVEAMMRTARALATAAVSSGARS